MMTIDELVRSSASMSAGPGGSSYLTEFDALWDSILVDLRLDLVRNRADLLIHGMGLPPEYNTAVIVVHAVRALSVTTTKPEFRTLRAIQLWKPSFENGLWTVETEDGSGGALSVTGDGAEIILGLTDVGELALPDFGSATDAEVAEGIVRWDSEFTPLARETVGDVRG